MNWLLLGIGFGISFLGLLLIIIGLLNNWIGVTVVVLGLIIVGYAKTGTWF